MYSEMSHQSRMPSARLHSNRSGGASLRNWLDRAFQGWRRRKMIGSLRQLDDRILKDIGIDRADIVKVVDGFDAQELAMRPMGRRNARVSERRAYLSATL